MKKLILLLVIYLSLGISCKKEEIKVTQFSASTVEGIIDYDSISYAIINYSDVNEIKDKSEYENPDIFSHTVKVEKPFTLTLKAEHTYLLKKFDLFDINGRLMFFIPYRSELTTIGGMALPFIFKAIDGGYSLSVTKTH